MFFFFLSAERNSFTTCLFKQLQPNSGFCVILISRAKLAQTSHFHEELWSLYKQYVASDVF